VSSSSTWRRTTEAAAAAAPADLDRRRGPERTLPIAGRYADAWHGDPDDAGELAEITSIIDRAAEEAGREPASILRASRLSISEPWDEVKATYGWKAEGGIGDLVIGWPSEGRGRLEDFLERILPAL
jgi:alkanesulfonate monooxygenase SsuD/methylene tetrahydromethanopterin reductase-like flavin-dependent oxidoreductase (luciferase family)